MKYLTLSLLLCLTEIAFAQKQKNTCYMSHGPWLNERAYHHGSCRVVYSTAIGIMGGYDRMNSQFSNDFIDPITSADHERFNTGGYHMGLYIRKHHCIRWSTQYSLLYGIQGAGFKTFAPDDIGNPDASLQDHKYVLRYVKLPVTFHFNLFTPKPFRKIYMSKLELIGGLYGAMGINGKRTKVDQRNGETVKTQSLNFGYKEGELGRRFDTGLTAGIAANFHYWFTLQLSYETSLQKYIYNSYIINNQSVKLSCLVNLNYRYSPYSCSDSTF